MVCAIVVACLVSTASADQHYNAHGHIAGRGDGKHPLPSANNHTSHAHVRNGKVHGVSVSHSQKGAVATQKVKSKKRRHARVDETGAVHTYFEGGSSDTTGQPPGMFVWLGWRFYDPFAQHWVYFWFPAQVVVFSPNDTDVTDCTDQ